MFEKKVRNIDSKKGYDHKTRRDILSTCLLVLSEEHTKYSNQD